MSFEDLGLAPQIQQALVESGYTTPTKIQAKAIPEILKGVDVHASAQTGTGKTASFLLPSLQRLMTPSTKQGKGPRALILAPTRELAMQIETQANKYSQHLRRMKTICVMGGVPYHKQKRLMQKPYELLIATPGRLIDLMNQKLVDFSRVEIVVLDEADRMLDMGFLEPVETILQATPQSRQTLLFSATLEGNIVQLSKKFMQDPTEIVIHTPKTKQDHIKQILHFADDLTHKNRLLDHLLEKEEMRHSIVFIATKRAADRLVRELREKGHRASALHGDMNQRQRSRTLLQMRKDQISILVATDVAARGIDIQSITHVINFDLPRNVEDYVHRIGRTGRAGAKGTALSFVLPTESGQLKKIKKFTGQSIERLEIKGLEPRKSPSDAPSKKRPFPKKKGHVPFYKRKKMQRGRFVKNRSGATSRPKSR